MQMLADQLIENIEAFIRGKPENLVVYAEHIPEPQQLPKQRAAKAAHSGAKPNQLLAAVV